MKKQDELTEKILAIVHENYTPNTVIENLISGLQKEESRYPRMKTKHVIYLLSKLISK